VHQAVSKKRPKSPKLDIPFIWQKKHFYIKIIFSGWLTGTPVNFGGITGRAQAVILKLIF
jgi:hypothetical protein